VLMQFRIWPATISTVFILFFTGSARGGLSPEPKMPPGWVPIPPPTRAEKTCANYALRQWHVALAGNVVAVSEQPPTSRDSLPFTIALKPREIGELGDSGDRHVLKVSDGYLVGFDDGEWDGSLWWFSSDGKTSHKLEGYSETAWHTAGVSHAFPRAGNVHAIVQLPTAIFAFVGIAHMTMNEGSIFRVERDSRGVWSATHVADIDGAPWAATAISPAEVVVATDTNIWLVTALGHVQRLHAINTSTLYAESLAARDSDTIFLGMRQYIVRLTRAGTTYTEQYYAPSDCPTLVATGSYSCKCVH